MSSTQAIDDPSRKPLIQIIDPVDPEECATVNVEEDDSGNIQNKVRLWNLSLENVFKRFRLYEK